jgi:hypothetical protein
MTLEQGIVEAVAKLQGEAKFGVYPWQVAQKLPDLDDRLWYCERKVRGAMNEMAKGGQLNRVESRRPSAKYSKRGYLVQDKSLTP